MTSRLDRLREGLDAPLLVTNLTNVFYLTGFESSNAALVVDPERAWAALLRDKKRSRDAINVVLLTDDGPAVERRPADEVRRELERLII